MKTKVKIWAITADIHNAGLDTELYGSIEEVREQQKLIIEESIAEYQLCQNGKPKPGPDCEKLTALLAENKLDEAWDYFIDEEGIEHPRDPDDCWHVMEHTVEVDVPDVPEELQTALKRAEAAFEDIRTHWSPNCLPTQVQIMRKAAEDDHAAVSEAIRKFESV